MYNYGVLWKQVSVVIKGDRDKMLFGNLDNENYRYQLKLDELYNLEILNEIIVLIIKDGNQIYLKDIGKVYMFIEKIDYYVYYNNKLVVSMIISFEIGIDILFI